MSFDLQPNLKGELIDLRPLRPEDWDERERGQVVRFAGWSGA